MRADRATAGPAHGRVRTRGQRVRRPRLPGRGERTAWGATPCWDGGTARRGHRGGASQQERPARPYPLAGAEQLADRELTRRLLEPEEVAWACSPEADAATGSVLHGDGGFAG